MKRQSVFFGFVLLAGLLVAACAPISEEACRAQSWNAIGIRDGERGEPLGRFASYAEECAKYGIRPIQSEWQSGREIGLKTYCTPKNAFQVGITGRRLSNVCSGNVRPLERAHAHGMEIHDIRDELRELESERRDIFLTLRHDLKNPQTPEERRLQLHYRRLLRQVEGLINMQEAKLARAEARYHY